jgi:DNA repair protein RecN (Recombination protein N)
MKRKYGNTLEEVVSYKDKIALQLEELDTSEQKIQELREIQIEQKRLLGKTALALSVKRKKFSKLLETKVESYLKGVGMDNAKFKVLINNRKDEDGLLISACGNTDSYIYGPDGIDDVQMLFSTNKNHPPLPLSQVASGGELSRIMLAIFVTVNSSDTNSTLVFDEIDSGVGGRTGTIIGQKLRDLSNQRQVICVTHLPQLASFAKNHWSITKKESNHKVVVAAHLLKGDEIIKELGLMIASGDKTSDTAAQAMIDQAKS